MLRTRCAIISVETATRFCRFSAVPGSSWTGRAFADGKEIHDAEWISSFQRLMWWQVLADAYAATGDERCLREWRCEMAGWAEDLLPFTRQRWWMCRIGKRGSPRFPDQGRPGNARDFSQSCGETRGDAVMFPSNYACGEGISVSAGKVAGGACGSRCGIRMNGMTKMKSAPRSASSWNIWK